ncbi:MAG: hypothetical protein GY842_01440 [bacterium]|nr:hypothetical protein [bacterium]
MKPRTSGRSSRGFGLLRLPLPFAALVSVLLLVPGCSALLRSAGVDVGDDGSDTGELRIRAGTYAGTGECDMALLVEGEDPVLDTIPLALIVIVDDGGGLVRDGIDYVADARVDLTLGRFALELTVVATTTTDEAFVANLEAAITIDAHTDFPLEMIGDAAETYSPEADRSIAYAFAADLVERDDAGLEGLRSMAYECTARLTSE